ncbi:MAG: UDP-N-acetylmuramoyl-tripeptide--D-alanyl-D-alanine ligase [Gammaproteobacteria bacterium]|nr:UDP-N-acetylmuramoyl-tripeptide--D-alanyl-D-alanine ligase [Gammaproteobacteria bacterium]
MNNWNLGDVAKATGGVLVGEAAAFTGVGTDTRKLEAGELFIALRGPNFDGHDFVQTALARGAAGLMVEHPVELDLPQIQVTDTRKALGSLGASWRAQFDLPVVAITGSSGKTTVKNLLASILAKKGETLATIGNLNNEIGVPLTLLKLKAAHEYAVIELGANQPGEIAYLANLVKPDVGIVNNVGPAHLEGFGDIEGVARAKGELYEALEKENIAVINLDEPYSDMWRKGSGAGRIITFGFVSDADFYVDRERIKNGGSISRFVIRTPEEEIQVELPLPGMHNISNALAAAASAAAAGADAVSIAGGLSAAKGVSGRMQVIDTATGVKVIDDTYNANPLSLKVAMQWLTSLGGSAWLVLGDMAELGGEAADLHRRAGIEAKRLGVKRLFTYGEYSVNATQAFGAGARHFNSIDALNEELKKSITSGVTVLIKGSRSMQMERVVHSLTTANSMGG